MTEQDKKQKRTGKTLGKNDHMRQTVTKSRRRHKWEEELMQNACMRKNIQRTMAKKREKDTG